MVFGLRTIGMGATVALTALVFAWSTVASGADQQVAVDQTIETLRSSAAQSGLSEIVEIDHARLAAAEDVDMPPARVLILSDPALNTEILTQNIRAGLDLPFRVLSFAEAGQAKALYTNYAFLARRHGLTEDALGQSFDAKLDAVLSSVEVEIAPAPVEKVAQDYGILELESAYDFATTIERLRAAVMSQGDTVWFGEIDYAAEAAALGQDLPPATLLLFGGPAPGGVAMKDFPAIGLDAFCQKLLVYTRKDGKVIVLYNDIAALAELHYATSIKPHHGLNARLTETFTKAVE